MAVALQVLEAAEEEARLLAHALNSSNEQALPAPVHSKLTECKLNLTDSSASQLLRSLLHHKDVLQMPSLTDDDGTYDSGGGNEESKSELEAMDGLPHVLQRLKGVLSRRIGTTVEEASSKHAQFERALAREQQASKEKQSLQKQLELERHEREKVWSQVTEHEERVIRDLEQVKSDAEHQYNAVVQQSHEENASIEQEFSERTQYLQDEVDRLKAELAQQRKENAEKESQEKKRKDRMETQLHEWKKEYERNVGARDKQIAELQAERENVNAKLEELESRYNQLREEANAYDAKMKKLEALREQREIAAKRDRSAAFIQQFWRFKTSKNSKKKKKKKGASSDAKKGSSPSTSKRTKK